MAFTLFRQGRFDRRSMPLKGQVAELTSPFAGKPACLCEMQRYTLDACPRCESVSQCKSDLGILGLLSDSILTSYL